MTIGSKNNITVSDSSKSSLNQKLILFVFFTIVSLTFFRCANIQRPTGGPKDSLAPVVLNESPKNFQTNFTAKEIVISFDEFIKLNNQMKEFSISPDLEKQPDYKIKKRNLHIKLPDSLEQNTTYTINFGKGLVDYNEGNPIINYNFVFATGPELDSLTISGRVSNAYTKTFDEKNDADVRVLLIPTRQDTIFGKKKANIFTSVDSAGNFKFQNLREDTYRIYALKEQNNDRIYNQPEESIGFINDSIVLDKDVKDIFIEFSKGKPQKLRTTERKIEKNGRILLIFNQPVDNPTLRILDPVDYNNQKQVNYTPTKDSSFIFLPKVDFDSIRFELSNNQEILDTIFIRRNKNEKYDRTLIPTFNISNKVEKVNHIKISSIFPIENIDKNKLILNEDSVSRRNFQLQKDSINNNLYHVRFNWRPKRNYELIIQENAITSLYADPNKEEKLNFTLDETDNFGDIHFEFSGLDSNTNYIVQLINEKKDQLFNTQTIRNKNSLSYVKFPGGKYTIRIIADLNENGRWDGANVYEKKQAEPIWYFNTTFTIRSNWEQNEKITVKFE